VTSSDSKIIKNFQRSTSSTRGLFADLLVKLAVINCHSTSASDILNFCVKIINNILVGRYY